MNNAVETEYDPLAQLAEHMTFNHGVRGSIPRWVTKKASRKTCFFYPLRKRWYIINDSGAIVVSHQPIRAVYHHALACIKNFHNDDIQSVLL